MQGIIASQRGVTPDGTCVNGASQYINMFGYLAYDGTSYDGSCSFFGAAEGRPPPLPEALGWTICLVLGLAFAALTSLMVFLSNRGVASEEQTGNNSEVFSTAGRTISAGLTAADVVSKWTWAATLLQSSNVAFAYGVSGPFWYASGATIQVILFAVLAIEIKRKCPAIHTMLEVVNARWGTAAHLTFLFFGLMTNLIVTAMLILGGAATINALTGMNTYAANFMIPVPVMLYTAFGGLKGTYYASFTHTFVIYLALLIFMYVGPSARPPPFSYLCMSLLPISVCDSLLPLCRSLPPISVGHSLLSLYVTPSYLCMSLPPKPRILNSLSGVRS